MKNPIFIISLFLVLFFLFGCNEVENKADDAVRQNNPALCKELDDDYEVKKCFKLVSEEMKDPNVCLQSTDPTGCVSNYASRSRSVKYCDLLKDDAAKYSCIVTVTGDQTGRTLDKILTDWRGNGTIINCKKGCEATKNTCTSKCWNIYIGKKDNCYKTYPSDFDNAYWCESNAKDELEDCQYDCWTEQDECDKNCEQ